MNFKFFCLIVVFFFNFFLVNSQNFYADVKFFVKDNGEVNIEGKSNFFQLKSIEGSHEFTSKDKDLWTFEVNYNDTFEDFIYEVYLPENSEVYYIKSSVKSRIEDSSGNLKIIGLGENKKLNILIEYKIKEKGSSLNKNFLFLLFLIFFVLLIYFLLINKFKFKFIKKGKKEEEDDKEKEGDKEKEVMVYEREYNINLLSERQKLIIILLLKNKRLTQKEIEEKLNIPKSSISRNINSLVLKSLIIKEQSGISNYIIYNHKIKFYED